MIVNYAKSIKNKNIQKNPYYKYFTKGLIIKIIGGILFCLTYALYYGGGDTVNYYKGVNSMMAVLINNPLKYIELLFAEDDFDYVRKFFIEVNDFPPGYMLKDYRTFTVIKISSVFAIFGLGGFLSTTILVSTFIYSWVWKLYVFLIERYATSYKAINIAILYLPSGIFWGSGIMKDTFTFGATCFAVFGLHQLFIQRKRLFLTIIQLYFAFFLIITIKAYIMFALLPGLLIFANFERLKKIKSTLVKIIILPFSIGILIFAVNTLFFDFNELFGKYSADNLLEEAAIQNADLQRSVYGANSFDIGTFEPTLQGAGSMFIPAVNAALFRPYITETGSPTMLLSGIENTIILAFVLWVILSKPFLLLKSFKNDPFLIFCLLFTLTLGFGVGLSTSNFGALVRYKIPFLPFFVFLILKQIEKFNNIECTEEKSEEPKIKKSRA